MSSLGSDYKHALIEHVSKIVLTVVLIGSILRPIFIDLPLIFSLFGGANAVAAVAVYWVIRSRWIPNLELPLVLALGFFTLTPLQFLSGGVNSQYSFIMPLFPLAAALMGGKIAALWVAAIQVFIIVLMLALTSNIIDMTGEMYVQEKVLSRGLWLLLSIGAGTYYGMYFQHLNTQLTNQLEQLATQDSLTGLLNRRGFDHQFDLELRRSNRLSTELSILVVDIDHFKSINDDYGHAAGDQCLQALARCFKDHVRDIDLVARMGGEEFALVLINTSEKDARTIAEHLRQKVSEIRVQSAEISFTVTIGIVYCDTCDATEKANLLKQADQALYEGKRQGRNCVVVSNREGSVFS